MRKTRAAGYGTKKQWPEHTTGREAVIEAALRVIARHGFEGATVRAIAREAGCTTGVPMHHFPTKDDLLLLVLERIFKMLDRGPVGRPPSSDPLRDLRDMFLEVLPCDEERRRAWRLWVYCAAQALHTPTIRAEHRRRYARVRSWLADRIRRAQRAGQLRRSVDPIAGAKLLLAALDGLGTHAVLEPETFPENLQIALMDRCFELFLE